MQNNTNEWQACEAGHLKRMVAKLQNRRLWRALKRDVAVGSVLVACVLSSYVGIDAWADSQSADLGGILCFEVSKLREVIVRGSLPPETAVCVRRHLAMCAHCRAGIELVRVQHAQADLPGELLDESVTPENHVAARGAVHVPLLSTVGY